MSRRRILKIALAALVAVAAVAVSYPFITSLNPGERARSFGPHDLKELEAGAIRKLDWVWVYRRTARDFESYEVAKTFYEPIAGQAALPAEADNALRSSSPEFFVFRPYAPLRACGVEFRDAYDYGIGAPPDATAMAAFPHFYDPCEGRIFDTTGRVLARQHYPPEHDLLVPGTKWLDGSRLLVQWDTE